MEPIYFIIQQAQLTRAKNPKKPNTFRSDITHQCLLTILDSPLNKAGKVKIFIHTVENVLIEINPAIRMPRALNRFNGLMTQLLNKLKIRAVTGEILMKVVKNPVSMYLPPNIIKVLLSIDGNKMEKCGLENERGYAFFVNAIAKGDDHCEGIELKMKVSDFGLSAAICCGKVCNMFEEIYSIF